MLGESGGTCSLPDDAHGFAHETARNSSKRGRQSSQSRETMGSSSQVDDVNRDWARHRRHPSIPS